MNIEIEKMRKKQEKQDMKDLQLKTIASRFKIKQQHNQIDRDIEHALEEGPKEIVQMDQYQEAMVKKAREQKLTDDLLNRELAQQQKLRKEIERNQEIQVYSQSGGEEGFLERLRKKDYEIIAAIRKRQSEEQDMKVITASYRLDVNGDPKFNPLITMEEIDKRAELKALKEK